jgi:hypothetical protein
VEISPLEKAQREIAFKNSSKTISEIMFSSFGFPVETQLSVKNKAIEPMI